MSSSYAEAVVSQGKNQLLLLFLMKWSILIGNADDSRELTVHQWSNFAIIQEGRNCKEAKGNFKEML